MDAGIAAGVSAAAALFAVIVTYILTRRREHEADWRKVKFAQYQEFILALSVIVEGRATPEAHRRYADAFNSMALVAPSTVLSALKGFQTEISYVNQNRTQEGHDRALNVLLRAMRADVHPRLAADTPFAFMLLGLPPEARELPPR